MSNNLQSIYARVATRVIGWGIAFPSQPLEVSPEVAEELLQSNDFSKKPFKKPQEDKE